MDFVWDEALCRRRVVEYDHVPWARRVAAAVGALPPGARLVDVATGPGFLLFELGRLYPEARLVATDGSAAMLAILGEEAARRGLTVEALGCPAEALALSDASVDVVVAKALFNLGAPPMPIVRELARVLRPGGHAFVIDFDRDAPRALRWVMGRLVVPAVGGRDTGRAFREASLRALSFEVVEGWLREAGLVPTPRVRSGIVTLVGGRKPS